MKRSRTIQLVLVGSLTAGVWSGCGPGKLPPAVTADNVYTNNYCVPGVGYYHAPFRAFYQVPYNFYEPKSQKYFSSGKARPRKLKVSPMALRGLLESLRAAIERLSPAQMKTEWSDYYTECSYSEGALERKAELVGSFLERFRPRTVWHMGGNIGFFSRLPRPESGRLKRAPTYGYSAEIRMRRLPRFSPRYNAAIDPGACSSPSTMSSR